MRKKQGRQYASPLTFVNCQQTLSNQLACGQRRGKTVTTKLVNGCMLYFGRKVPTTPLFLGSQLAQAGSCSLPCL